MTARQEARRALTSALRRLNYPTDSSEMDVLGALVERFFDLPPDASDEEFRAIAEVARDLQFQREIGLRRSDSAL